MHLRQIKTQASEYQYIKKQYYKIFLLIMMKKIRRQLEIEYRVYF